MQNNIANILIKDAFVNNINDIVDADLNNKISIREFFTIEDAIEMCDVVEGRLVWNFKEEK